MTQEEIQKRIRRMASRAWWAGLVAGVLLGLIAGLAIGYHLGSPQTIVVPLSQGIRT
jgi:Mg/Co/Ni transporter MgtE